MPAFSFSASVTKNGVAAMQAAYIMRTGPYASGRTTSREDLVAAGFGNLPAGFTDADEFWAAADEHGRSNGRAADVRIMTLPRGLDAAQQEQAALRAAREWCGEDRAYTWAVHNPDALDGGEQPHVHLMRSQTINDGIEREPDQYFRRHNPEHPERGGARKATVPRGTSQADRAAAMMAERVRWAEICNDASAAAGVLDRVDPRSNKARGLLRVPEPKLRRDQRSNPEALAELQKRRAAWKQVEEADARVVMLETAERERQAGQAAAARLESAERPREMPTSGPVLAPRQMRAAAVKAAREKRAEEGAAARLESAERPREMPVSGPALAPRQVRAAAIKAATEQRAEEGAEVRVRSAKRPRQLPAASTATKKAQQLRAEAVTIVRSDRAIAEWKEERASIQRAELEASQQAEDAKATRQKQEQDKQAAERAAQQARTDEAARAAQEQKRLRASTKPDPSSTKAPKPGWRDLIAGIVGLAKDTGRTPAEAIRPPDPIVPARPTTRPAPPVEASTYTPMPPPPRSVQPAKAEPVPEPSSHDRVEAEGLLRADGVIRVSKDGTAAVFRPTAAESAMGLPVGGWRISEGLAGLEAVLAKEGVQPSRKEPTSDGSFRVEYRINDLVQMLTRVTQKLAEGLVGRMRVATEASNSRWEEHLKKTATPTQEADAPAPAAVRPRPTRGQSRRDDGMER